MAKNKTKPYSVAAGIVTYSCNDPKIKKLLQGISSYVLLMDRILTMHKGHRDIKLKVTQSDAFRVAGTFLDNDPRRILVNTSSPVMRDSAVFASMLVHETVHCFDFLVTDFDASGRRVQFFPKNSHPHGARALIEAYPYNARTEYYAHIYQLLFLEIIMTQCNSSPQDIEYEAATDAYVTLIDIQHFIDSTKVMLDVEGYDKIRYGDEFPVKVPGPLYEVWHYDSLRVDSMGRPAIKATMERLNKVLVSYRARLNYY